jgi:ribosomal protein L29
MKYKELTTKSEAELKHLLGELKQQVHELSVKARLNQLKNNHQIGAAKKDIARIMTFLRSKVAK